MGQPVNPLLGNTQAMLGADPELYRQQLVQAEQQRFAAMPPQQGLAAQLGTLLGRGISNVANDRGFFEVSNPVLQNLTKIQGVYNQAMQASDPDDPLSFYKELQSRFTQAGLPQQAMMAVQEGRKFEAEDIKTKSAKLDLYAKNKELLWTDIAKFREQGKDAKANELAGYLGQIQRKEDIQQQKDLLDLAVKNSALKVDAARIAQIYQGIEDGKVQIVQTPQAPGSTTPPTISVFRNGKLESQVTVGQAFELNPSGAAKPGESKEKPNPASFDKRNQSAPAAPASAPAQTQAASAPAAPAATQTGNLPPLDPQTRIYYAARDPVLKALRDMAAADPQRLATDPAYFASITQARNDQIETLKRQYGNMVSFEGL